MTRMRHFLLGLYIIPVAINVGAASIWVVLRRRQQTSSDNWFARLCRRFATAVNRVSLTGYIVRRIDARLPEFVERKRSGYWLHTAQYNGRIRRLAEWLPTRIVDVWLAFGVFVLGLATLAISIYGLSYLAYAGLGAVDWLATVAPGAATSYDPSAVGPISWSAWLVAIGWAVVGVGVGAVIAVVLADVVLLAIAALSWVIILPFLPGLVLHELGHAIAVYRAGGRVKSVGVFTLGLMPGGAFVEPDEASLSGASRWATLGVWAAGIGNTVLWAAVLLAAAWVAITQFGRPVVGYWLAIGGLFELANAGLNAIPIGPVDGGGFTRTLLAEWWGFDAALSEGRL